MNINIEDDIVPRLAAAIRPQLDDGGAGLNDNRVVRRYTRHLLRSILTAHEVNVAVAAFDVPRETARRQAVAATQSTLTGEG